LINDHLNNFVQDKDHEIFSGTPISVRRKRLFGARTGNVLLGGCGWDVSDMEAPT